MRRFVQWQPLAGKYGDDAGPSIDDDPARRRRLAAAAPRPATKGRDPATRLQVG
jgi:hypothetical protein